MARLALSLTIGSGGRPGCAYGNPHSRPAAYLHGRSRSGLRPVPRLSVCLRLCLVVSARLSLSLSLCAAGSFVLGTINPRGVPPENP